MGGSKYARFLVSGCYSEVCPLFFIWVVADDRNDFAFLVNDGNACLKLGNGSVIAMKGNSAWPAQSCGVHTDPIAVQIEVD